MPEDSPNSRKEQVEGILHRTYPLSGDYVTRPELLTVIQHFETKIINSELRQRNWVLGGCLAIIIAFGGGYMSLVSKLDRLSDAMPNTIQTLEARRSWILRKDQQDADQDSAIQSLAPRYRPAPYVEPPK